MELNFLVVLFGVLALVQCQGQPEGGPPEGWRTPPPRGPPITTTQLKSCLIENIDCRAQCDPAEHEGFEEHSPRWCHCMIRCCYPRDEQDGGEDGALTPPRGPPPRGPRPGGPPPRGPPRRGPPSEGPPPRGPPSGGPPPRGPPHRGPPPGGPPLTTTELRACLLDNAECSSQCDPSENEGFEEHSPRWQFCMMTCCHPREEGETPPHRGPPHRRPPHRGPPHRGPPPSAEDGERPPGGPPPRGPPQRGPPPSREDGARPPGGPPHRGPPPSKEDGERPQGGPPRHRGPPPPRGPPLTTTQLRTCLGENEECNTLCEPAQNEGYEEHSPSWQFCMMSCCHPRGDEELPARGPLPIRPPPKGPPPTGPPPRRPPPRGPHSPREPPLTTTQLQACLINDECNAQCDPVENEDLKEDSPRWMHCMIRCCHPLED